MRSYLHEQAVHYGKKEINPKSKAQIKGFVETYGIKMNEFEPSDIDAYDSFESKSYASLHKGRV